ncbi:hypothetical protein ACIA8K_30855 [Catenuloplanes sp. NPDC051500]|uniref:hypothetical protein n=1 Tax=Catenuloplanes sp. NPDC051500 TaxID=3363959 RepID=UPI0037B1A1D7
MARTLAKDPVDRPTAPELLELLLDTGSHSVADLTGRPELEVAAQAARAQSRRGRRPARVLAAVLAGVLAVAVAGAAGAWAALRDDTAAVVLPAPSSPPQAPALGNGPVIIDRLDRPGQWPAATSEDGSCAYTGGRLVISDVEPVWHACDGPDDLFAGDSSIAVTVALLEPGSCAFVAFRLTADDEYNGYLLRLCADAIGVERHADDRAEDIGTTETAVLAGGGEHRVAMEIRDEVATVRVDGATIATAAVDDRRAVTGWFRLGLEAEPDAEAPTGSVAYRNVEIRTL